MFKQIVMASLVAVVAASGASAGVSSKWKDTFDYQASQGFDGSSSTIEIRGRFGNHVSSASKFSDEFDRLTNAKIINNVTEFTEGGDGHHYYRDFGDYKITGNNAGQTFYVVESDLNGTANIDGYEESESAYDQYKGYKDKANENQVIYKGNSFFNERKDFDQYAETVEWEGVEAGTFDYFRATKNDEGLLGDQVSIVIESNYNSKAYLAHVLGSDAYSDPRKVTTEYEVGYESTNEDAKQIVASAVAVAFDKFSNLDGNEVRNILVDNANGRLGKTIGLDSVNALFTPQGQLK